MIQTKEDFVCNSHGNADIHEPQAMKTMYQLSGLSRGSFATKYNPSISGGTGRHGLHDLRRIGHLGLESIFPKRRERQGKFWKQPRLTVLPTILDSVIIGNWSVRWLGFCFLKNIRRREKSVELAATELTAARMYWIRVVQKEAFTADLQSLRKNLHLPRVSKIARFHSFLEYELIRLGGRLVCWTP